MTPQTATARPTLVLIRTMDHFDTWNTLINQWLVRLRQAGRPDTTLELRRYQLRRLAHGINLDPYILTGEDLIAWTGEQAWARETRRSHRSAFIAFFDWMQRTGRRSDNPALELDRIPTSPPNPHPAARSAILNALNDAPPRERLALRLASERGLRRGELVLIHRRDIIDDILGHSLIVHGKGGKLRIAPLSDSLARLAIAACDTNGGWAFPGQIDGHMSPHWMGKLISRRLPEGVTAHSLRHAFATTTYLATGDLLAVQQLLGHASPDTTQRYVRVPDQRLRTVASAADHDYQHAA